MLTRTSQCIDHNAIETRGEEDDDMEGGGGGVVVTSVDDGKVLNTMPIMRIQTMTATTGKKRRWFTMVDAM